MSRSSFSPNQSGQIGVIILLIMVVLLTIGLSVAARTTKEVRLAGQETESTRVFSAAELGVEKALATDLTTIPDVYRQTAAIPESNANLDYTITKMRNLQTHLFEGSSAVVNLLDSGASTPAVNALTINWGKNTNCTQNPAALVISIYSVDQAVVPPRTAVRYRAITPCNTRSDSIPVSNTAGSNGFFRSMSLPIQANDRVVRIKAVYADTDLYVTGTNGGTPTDLPVQYYNIRSTASNSLGNETRTVEVNRTLPVAPGILDFVVFSGTTVSK
jgi:Tfp pilus assembly protein PilX